VGYRLRRRHRPGLLIKSPSPADPVKRRVIGSITRLVVAVTSRYGNGYGRDGGDLDREGDNEQMVRTVEPT
jgi:hypothetical protein